MPGKTYHALFPLKLPIMVRTFHWYALNVGRLKTFVKRNVNSIPSARTVQGDRIQRRKRKVTEVSMKDAKKKK